MLDVIFLTSNRVKRDNVLRHLKGSGIRLLPPPEYGRPYVEPRILNRNKLLDESILDANVRLLKTGAKGDSNAEIDAEFTSLREIALRVQSRLFFVEDTSVRIDALSDAVEFPGVDVKYWMKETSFKDLDNQLKRRKKGRHVSVRSDVALYIPPYLRHLTGGRYYVVFTGVSCGSVTKSDIVSETNTLYPWLDNKTFNKWFVPEGEKLPISLLPIDKADKHDFRRKALEKMEAFLKETGLLSPVVNKSSAKQFDLFPVDSLVVCGPTCSGKTTLAQFLVDRYGFYHIEASDFMHLAYYHKHGIGSDVAIHDFAMDALENDPSIVSARIISFLRDRSFKDFVITGFRSPKEIDSVVGQVPIEKFFYIHTDKRIRMQRSIQRGRGDSFEKREAVERKMGVYEFSFLPYFAQVTNEGSLDDYLEGFCEEYINKAKIGLPPLQEKYNLRGGLREAIILALYAEGGSRSYSTAQIADLINKNVVRFSDKDGHPFETSKNNVSRYFHMNIEPYFDYGGDKDRYEIKLSNTGISEAKFLIRRIAQ